jgi:L-ascorbate metabolism protein UlaG (beta-lactamase superfamily)
VLVPVNGAVVSFPHRRPASPLPAALTPEQGAIAAEVLGARVAIPIHAEGYEIDGVYEPVADATSRFLAAAAERGVPARPLAPGETVELSAVQPPAGSMSASSDAPHAAGAPNAEPLEARTP